MKELDTLAKLDSQYEAKVIRHLEELVNERKEVVIKGIKFVIKKLKFKDAVTLSSKLEKNKVPPDLYVELIVKCVEFPKLTKELVEALPPDVGFNLLKEIFDFSGLTEGKVKVIKK